MGKKLLITAWVFLGCLLAVAILGIVMETIRLQELAEMQEADKEDGIYKIELRKTFSIITLIDNKTGDEVSHLCKIEIYIPENDYEPHLIGIANKMEIDMRGEKTLNIVIDPDGESIWKTDFINFTCSMEDNYRFYITVYRK